MKADFLNRNVNEGFSGGERKRNEILQLAVLGADLAILDEIDSGLDVDALRDVAAAVNGLLTPKNSVLMITHYARLFEYHKAYIYTCYGLISENTLTQAITSISVQESLNALIAAWLKVSESPGLHCALSLKQQIANSPLESIGRE
uniref:Uncharacterized protein n=1 Tax=Quercus lobata TaxID=97700 RepID=A0A7N2LHQ3_QUELO